MGETHKNNTQHISDLLAVAFAFLATRLNVLYNSELERPTLSLKSTGTNKCQKGRCQNTLDFYNNYCAPMCGAPISLEPMKP
eukprot:15493572-Heterocapsa_arctica.AAC.1